ncbi:hypothetical protein E2C01_061431 [Portunus trituberculatus]|uniref:Uncharacterized protein n=1 Tax=Portunus trituberculatus TaxID=210409 RepID=A0A5B7HEC6_PORTR|nr:hypothetical protein [Portunus trituberculatus]
MWRRYTALRSPDGDFVALYDMACSAPPPSDHPPSPASGGDTRTPTPRRPQRPAAQATRYSTQFLAASRVDHPNPRGCTQESGWRRRIETVAVMCRVAPLAEPSAAPPPPPPPSSDDTKYPRFLHPLKGNLITWQGIKET